MTACEDCGEGTGKGTDSQRRRRCPHCGMMVCGWCWWRTHEPEIERRREARVRRQQAGKSPEALEG